MKMIQKIEEEMKEEYNKKDVGRCEKYRIPDKNFKPQVSKYDKDDDSSS